MATIFLDLLTGSTALNPGASFTAGIAQARADGRENRLLAIREEDARLQREERSLARRDRAEDRRLTQLYRQSELNFRRESLDLQAENQRLNRDLADRTETRLQTASNASIERDKRIRDLAEKNYDLQVAQYEEAEKNNQLTRKELNLKIKQAKAELDEFTDPENIRLRQEQLRSGIFQTYEETIQPIGAYDAYGANQLRERTIAPLLGDTIPIGNSAQNRPRSTVSPQAQQTRNNGQLDFETPGDGGSFQSDLNLLNNPNLRRNERTYNPLTDSLYEGAGLFDNQSRVEDEARRLLNRLTNAISQPEEFFDDDQFLRLS